MKKSDLETGHVVQTRNGEFYTVFLNHALNHANNSIINEGGWCSLDHYTEGISVKHVYFSSQYDIIEVFKPESPLDTMSHKKLKSIWRREEEEIIELTIDQIAEKYGKEPSQIKIKK